MTRADIVRDLRDMKAHHIDSVMIWGAYGLEADSLRYLSPKWFERVRFAVEQARQLDMRVWLVDEGGYPSGFAGGEIGKEHPNLRMRMLTAGEPVPLRKGRRISLKLPAELVAAVAINRAMRSSRLLSVDAGGTLQWAAPDAGWEILVLCQEFRTAPTRYVHTPDFRKDASISLIDFLNPAASRQFLRSVYERYKESIGGEFGKTVLGFMGEEPNYAGLPWTPLLPEEFKHRKGYDLRPHLAKLVYPDISADARSVRADYFDVWTDLFSDNFFKMISDWCQREGLEYTLHLWGEGDLKALIAHNGDFFKINRTVQVPGVDCIWREIWPGKTADFPKLASSVAHLEGRPRAFTESYAVYGAGLSLEQAKWIMDHQLVRGINLFSVMAYLSSTAEYRPYLAPPSWSDNPLWPYFGDFAQYANRLCYLLSVGRPAADIALYYPTTSGWLGDFEAEESAVRTARALLENQRDFDFIDEEGLRSSTTVRDGCLLNRSGQCYKAVIVPSVTAVSQSALKQLEMFAEGGGRVLFLGKLPAIIPGRTYLHASPGASSPLLDSLSRRQDSVLVESSGKLTDRALAWLPDPNVELQPNAPAVKYLHRRLQDGEIFFFFNESDQLLDLEAQLMGSGTPMSWDPLTGAVDPVPASKDGRSVRVPLLLEPFETKLVVFSPGEPAGENTVSERDQRPLTVLEIAGEWSIAIGGKSIKTNLKPWSYFGLSAYWGVGRYHKQFHVPSCLCKEAGDLFLDLGEVRYAARVWLNGQYLGRRAWRPFRWNIRDYLRSGWNELRVEVTNTRANELAGSPSKYDELERKGWLKSPFVRQYTGYDAEMVPSGLMGPVRIMCSKGANRATGR